MVLPLFLLNPRVIVQANLFSWLFACSLWKLEMRLHFLSRLGSFLKSNYCKHCHSDKINQSQGRTRMIHSKILIWANQMLNTKQWGLNFVHLWFLRFYGIGFSSSTLSQSWKENCFVTVKLRLLKTSQNLGWKLTNEKITKVYRVF